MENLTLVKPIDSTESPSQKQITTTNSININMDIKIQLGEGLSGSAKSLTIYEITDSTPNRAFHRSDAHGVISNASFDSACQYFYALLQVETESGSNATFLSIFDNTATEVAFGEQLTIANIFCFCQFLQSNHLNELEVMATDRQCKIATSMRDNFMSVEGVVSDVITSSPNGLETNSLPLFNYTAGLLYYTITDTVTHDQFLSYTNADFILEGFLNLAKNPFDNVSEIYHLVDTKPPIFPHFLPHLDLSKTPDPSPIPNQWTLTIKVNDSGAQNFLIGGPGFLVFDKNDRAWITNNVRQGTVNSSTFCVVLEPNGSPAPFSPVFGGGQLGAGIGVAVDNEGENIYFGNFGWGTTQDLPQKGSISQFSSDGKVLSPPNGFTNGNTRPQGMVFDKNGNLWVCSWGSQAPMPPVPTLDNVYQFADTNSAVVCYLGGDMNNAPLRFEFGSENGGNHLSPDYQPFGIYVDSNEDVVVANGGKGDLYSSVYKVRLNNDNTAIDYVNKYEFGDAEKFKQMIVNKDDEIFVTGLKTSPSTVYKLSITDINAEILNTYTNKISYPWGLTIDDKGTIYVANFGTDDTPTEEYGVAVIKNEDDSTTQLMTLPSGGHEVMLANGLPLYGNTPRKRNPCYSPLMRLTSSAIDRAGNLWVCNNWKPSFKGDLKLNPGGDGMVIFVGVAAPKEG